MPKKFNHYTIDTNAKEKQIDSLNDKTIYFIYSKQCGPCQMFMDTWKSFVKKDVANTTAIEVGTLGKLKSKELLNITGSMMKKRPFVPNVAKMSKKRLVMFNKDRTIENLESFI